MVRGKPSQGDRTPKQEQSRLLFLQTGNIYDPGLLEFDPDAPAFLEAILLLMSEGGTVVLRPGSGGRSFGVAVWQGDVRYPPTWLYDDEEINAWSQKVVSQLKMAKTGD